jgi:hypothetical protein
MNTRPLVPLWPQSARRAGSFARTLFLALTDGAAKIAARIRRRYGAWRKRVRAESLTYAVRDEDWEGKAREDFLRRSIDVGDLECRQRVWDRDEASGYRLSGWP